MTTESCTNGATTLSRANFSGYVGHVTIFSLMLTTACCIVSVRVRIGFSVWLASGYADVFILLSVVIVTVPFRKANRCIYAGKINSIGKCTIKFNSKAKTTKITE